MSVDCSHNGNDKGATNHVTIFSLPLMTLDSSDNLQNGLLSANSILNDEFTGIWPSPDISLTPPETPIFANGSCSTPFDDSHAAYIGGTHGTVSPGLGQEIPNATEHKVSQPHGTRGTGVDILKKWFDQHCDKPYPTKKEKMELASQSGLTLTQISTWFANTRRRRKNKSLCPNPLLTSTRRSINIRRPLEGELSLMSPMERWRNSPPEAEGVSLDAIMGAVVNSDFAAHQDPYIRYSERSTPSDARSAASSNASGSAFSHNSVSSTHSIGSHSSAGSFHRFYSAEAPRRRRRRKRATAFPKRAAKTQEPRPFQCTFCTDTFRTKYDWTRHEKTLHLSLESYTCCSSGPTHADTAGSQRCCFCDHLQPTNTHIESHFYTRCQEKPVVLRTFYRKDHLIQHLRLVHGVSQFLPGMEGWKMQVDNINSRCGLCDTTFVSWSARNEHIGQHFRNGALMKDWKGSRGLDPSVAFAVENAMPPYLIGIEAVTPDPFSASRLPNQSYPGDGLPTPWPQLQSGAKRSPFNHFTVDLTNFVREAQFLNQPITDTVLQTAGRRILFDDEDTWNQTPADNPEWLQMFKRAVCLECEEQDNLSSARPPLSVEDFDFFPSSAEPWAVWNIFDANIRTGESTDAMEMGVSLPWQDFGSGTESRKYYAEDKRTESETLPGLISATLDELEKCSRH
ncbi:hypothetical protein BDW72DRAFT_207423 [Aspergillus terricola var. indicus]